jgi:Uma2 family endonuclease
MTVDDKLYTADDLWAMSHQSAGHKRLALIKGVIVEMSPTGAVHGIVAACLLHLIMSFVREHGLGYVTAAETGFILAEGPPQTVLAPDVGFISKAHGKPPTEKYYPLPPDLAVEVVSPSDTAKDVRDKVAAFLLAGTRLVWVVYPDSRLVDVYRPGRTSQTFEATHVLDGEDVLPGFTLPVKDIFQDLDE